jgi:hypothetical protein
MTRNSSTSRQLRRADKVRANIPKRDHIFDDDYAASFSTPSTMAASLRGDFNPLGVQADGIWTDGQGEDFNPDIVMESRYGHFRRVDCRSGDSIQVAAVCRRERQALGRPFGDVSSA